MDAVRALRVLIMVLGLLHLGSELAQQAEEVLPGALGVATVFGEVLVQLSLLLRGDVRVDFLVLVGGMGALRSDDGFVLSVGRFADCFGGGGLIVGGQAVLVAAACVELDAQFVRGFFELGEQGLQRLVGSLALDGVLGPAAKQLRNRRDGEPLGHKRSPLFSRYSFAR